MIDALLDECTVHIQSGRIDDAAEIANEACELALKTLPLDDPLTAQALRTAAVIETQRGQHERARMLLTKLESRFEPDDHRRAIALSDLANLELSIGDHDAAARILRAAIDLFDENDAKFGAAVTPLLGMLASITAVAGDTDEAQRLTVRVLGILISEEGENSPNVADTLTFSSLLALRANDVEGACAVAQRAIAIYERTGADAHRSAVANAIVEDAEGFDAKQVLESGLPPRSPRTESDEVS